MISSTEYMTINTKTRRAFVNITPLEHFSSAPTSYSKLERIMLMLTEKTASLY